MALIKTIQGKSPQLDKAHWIAENATIVGDVQMEYGVTVWYNAVIRGDVNRVQLGKNVNVQDGAVIHCTYEKSKTQVGENVSIGHNAIVHGCHIAPNVLIGMGAIVMDHAVINSNTIIAAGSVVLENSQLEPNAIYAGTPVRKVKALSQDQFEQEIERIASNYRMYAEWQEEPR